MAEDQTGDIETVRDLTRQEHLLVCAMRAIALGHEECPGVINAFRRACGPEGDRMLQIYAIFIKSLAAATRRRLQVHVPGCLCVGSDEAAALAIIAAGQRSLRDHNEAGLRAALRGLTGGQTDETLVLMVQGLARVLDLVGVSLPPREAIVAPPVVIERRPARLLS